MSSHRDQMTFDGDIYVIGDADDEMDETDE